MNRNSAAYMPMYTTELAMSAAAAAAEGGGGATSVRSVMCFDVGTTNLGVCCMRRVEAPPLTGDVDVDIQAAQEAVTRYPGRVVTWDLVNLGATSADAAVEAVEAVLWARRSAIPDDLTDVCVESQDMARDVMKAVEAAIKTFFRTWSRMNPMGHRLRVRAMHGAHKMHIYVPAEADAAAYPPTPGRFPANTRTNKYAWNKAMSVLLCKTILDDWGYAAGRAFLDTHPKQDDLTDAFNMCIWCLQHPDRLHDIAPCSP